jgi:MT0933-like antitoxin protein
MSDLGDVAKKAEQYTKDHPDDVDKGIQEGEKITDQHTGDKYDKQVEEGGEQVEKRLGDDQNPQGDQNPQQEQ